MRTVGLAIGLATLVVGLWASVAFAAPPVNDDFADAQVLSDGVPVAAIGDNLEATSETGEPVHGTFGSSGHSVWFEWEAVSTESVTVRICDSDFAAVLAVYTGAAVDALSKVAAGSFGLGCPPGGTGATFTAAAGETYEIAVDGDPTVVPPDGEGTFGLRIDSTPPPGDDDEDRGEDRLLADTKPPNTFIHKRKVKSRWGRATFAFGSSELGSKFRCRLDGRPFVACRSPKTYRSLSSGRHTFRVVAADASGNVDRHPAVAHFRIAESKHRQPR